MFLDYRRFAWLAAVFSFGLISSSYAAEAYVAIIVDDMGYNLHRGTQAIELPGPLTYAVLPYTQYGPALAKAAHASNKEVILHLPMANLTNEPLGPGALNSAQSKADFLASVDSAIKQVPFAQGINNHTGSYLTQQVKQMNWLMQALKARNLFFIDSRTTAKSVAYKVAQRNHLATSRRDIFLDNEQSINGIDHEFQLLIKKAKQRGTAIAIGHPYQSTLTYLAEAIPKLQAQGITVVSVSELIDLQQKQIAAANLDSGNTASD